MIQQSHCTFWLKTSPSQKGVVVSQTVYQSVGQSSRKKANEEEVVCSSILRMNQLMHAMFLCCSFNFLNMTVFKRLLWLLLHSRRRLSIHPTSQPTIYLMSECMWVSSGFISSCWSRKSNMAYENSNQTY